MRIAIIGGGIAGMAAAFELEKARAAGAPVEYTLYESSPRLGGVLASKIVNGAVLELGPDSFLTEKPATAELCRELGLGDALIGSNDADRKDLSSWCATGSCLCPTGSMFLVPTKLVPTALTRAVQPAHQGAAWRWSCCIRRGARAMRTSQWPRWWSGTLERRPWTGWPIRCSRESMAAMPRN